MVAVAIAGVVALFVLVGVIAAYLAKLQKQAPKAAQPEEEEEDTVVVGGGARRRGAMNRRRGRPAPAARAQAAGPSAQSGDSEGDEGDEDEEAPLDRKEAKRREREAQREAERAAREAKANKVSKYEERRKKKDEEREAQERAQEEEMRRAAEERQKAEDEEAAKWMSMISVETEGDGAAEAAEESAGLLGRFIAYIQERKMVPIEDIATEFHLRSSEVVDRIQGLEAMGRLTGVMDERGKYIYISEEEMAAVAAFIRKQGRVALAELAARSNELVDLEGKAASATEAAGDTPMVDFDSMLLGGEVEPVGA